MKNERKTSKRPAIAYVSVFLAPSTFLGSPPEVISCMPEVIIKNRENIPAKVIAQSISAERIPTKQLRVGTVSDVPLGSLTVATHLLH